MIDLRKVWEDDVFNRSGEATDIIRYLENTMRWPHIRKDGHAHVLAVDGSYGQGKTFFLKRLDLHLKATEHVSAYVDAWTDDLEDQPLVALAATLEGALSHWTADHPNVSTAVQGFIAKTGKVAKIVGVGLFTKLLGFGITEVGAHALHDVIAGAGDDVQREIRKDALKEAGGTVADGFSKSGEAEAHSDMAERIERFKSGQKAVEDMKQSLRAVVAAVQEVGLRLPITIIVDELDRCRPTYAIKVLEEIKHLFDVEGVAFILGMHGQQLAHSVQAAYGSSFNGQAYLRRFFNRTYSLQDAGLSSLIDYLFKRLYVKTSMLVFPDITPTSGGDSTRWEVHEVVAEYMKIYEMTARDVFAVVEALHVATALADEKLMGALLLPIVLSKIKGSDQDYMGVNETSWMFVWSNNKTDGTRDTASPNNLLKALRAAARLGALGIEVKIQQGLVTNVEKMLYLFSKNKHPDGLDVPGNYQKLVEKVGRFMPEGDTTA